MAENLFDVIGDMATITEEVQNFSQCLKCSKIVSHLLQHHLKTHPGEEFIKCRICHKIKFKVGIMHLSLHAKLIRLLMPWIKLRRLSKMPV